MYETFIWEFPDLQIFFFELETMRENFGIKLTFYSHGVNTHFYSYKVTIGMDQELPS